MTTANIPPAEKLARTRARMVAALAATKQSSANEAQSENGLLASILAMYLAQHPLPATGNAISHTLEKVVAPWVRENPIQAVLAAALAGGLLIWSRPWNLLRPPAPLAWLLPQLLTKLMARRDVPEHQGTDQR
jgi:hypothetical protein